MFTTVGERCQSLEWDYVVSKGLGTLYSYVVLHHPQIPGYDFPLVVCLVDLDEGTRIVSNVLDCAPEELEYMPNILLRGLEELPVIFEK